MYNFLSYDAMKSVSMYEIIQNADKWTEHRKKKQAKKTNFGWNVLFSIMTPLCYVHINVDGDVTVKHT